MGGARPRLKIVRTQGDLWACLRLLHDAYVASGFMKPCLAGQRMTPYQARATTTPCATLGAGAVGMMSLIREGMFGFQLQRALEPSGMHARQGRIVEIPAQAGRRRLSPWSAR